MTAKDRYVAEGYCAYWQADDLEDNPYDKYSMSTQYEFWEEGWYDAADEEIMMEQ